jgi:hypothetical protein
MNSNIRQRECEIDGPIYREARPYIKRNKKKIKGGVT